MRIEHFLQHIGYQISSGEDFLWQCFGNNARFIDAGWNGFNVSCVFDTVTRIVYNIEVYDDCKEHYGDTVVPECIWINSDYLEQYKEECIQRNVEETLYENLNSLEEVVEILNTIFQTNTEIVDINLPKDTELDLFRLAHKKDITFNELIIEILRNLIEELGNVSE